MLPYGFLSYGRKTLQAESRKGLKWLKKCHKHTPRMSCGHVMWAGLSSTRLFVSKRVWTHCGVSGYAVGLPVRTQRLCEPRGHRRLEQTSRARSPSAWPQDAGPSSPGHGRAGERGRLAADGNVPADVNHGGLSDGIFGEIGSRG